MITGASTRWPPQSQVAQPAVLPVPMAGINAVSSMAAMAPQDAVFLYNAHPSTLGVRVRDGYEEHVVPDPAIGPIRTIIPFHGVKSDASDTKLFVATPNGIYDVTAAGTTATSKIAFVTQTGRAGWGSFSSFQIAGAGYIAYCDEVNGYYLYTASTNTWARVVAGAGAGQINGANPNNFVQVLNWKNRLWFVEKDTAQAWYLPVNQYAGTVASFGFGGKFPQGGALASIANWTVDGGAGVDDRFIAVSNAGDVAMYEGTDPAFAATFELKGYWNVGRVPPGRRFVWDMGGDLLILSSRGVTSMLRLLTGSQSPQTPDFFVSFKIGNLIGNDMAEKVGDDGWSLHLHPRRNIILITTPTDTGATPIQYAMYAPTAAWSVYRDMPMLCQGVWNGELYFGTADGRVCIHRGTRDNGSDIPYSGMTAYTDLGAPGRNKRIGLIRPVVVSVSASPRIDVQARWDFDLSEIATAPSGTDTSGTAWDSADWDAALWGGSKEVSGEFRGATGIGHRAAVAFRGLASVETALVSFDITVDAGGIL